MKKITLLAFSLFAGISMTAQIVLTQNTGTTVTAINSVGCPSGDNSWARNFILANYAVDPATDFIIGSGAFGVQSNSADINVTVTIYSSNANFPTGFTGINVLGNQVVAVPALTSEDPITVSFDFTTPVVVPAGTTAILYSITTQPIDDMFIGGTASETVEGFLKSATCGVATYTTPTAIGFPDANFFMTLTQEDDLGVSENLLASSMSLFPNPTNGDLNIKFSKSVGSTTVDITNLSGQKVLSASVDGFGTKTLATSALASGVYFAKVYTGSESTVVKFIKN